ncbi:MAG: alpha-1,4-glucan--maltose-1-phosphate maltosyltransferase [Betaproteobacteria bacterium]|nr:alpha-1,4-glucan--maltose-1-phosphate maltosyltransferase [Betaproteobacteria bacterium]
MADIVHPEGRRRVVIEEVTPQVDGGRFPVKRTVGETVVVEADAFADGHDAVRCVLRFRKEDAPGWTEAPMQAVGNDRWRGEFTVTEMGEYRYTVAAWVDRFLTWRGDLERREDPEDIGLALKIGAALVEAAADRAPSQAAALRRCAEAMRDDRDPLHGRRLALDEELGALVARFPDRRFETIFDRELRVTVDRERARFGAWYEMFPRSCVSGGQDHGDFRSCEEQLAYIAGMGFDVLYLPPIHPVGLVNRKGRNNTLTAGPDDPGSPWAVGAAAGGHKAVHPQLGTLEDFRRFMERAREHGLEIALDVAFQCAPDHPYVKAHPRWFRWRPDGSVQYAENPPKKYQDIYPFDFETEDWGGVWEELKDIVRFWLREGVRIFRVDNPHTKPFGLWESLIAEVKRDCPEAIFLSEAFTRPKVMLRLAKLGFTQSYTYFAWRNTRRELEAYFTELSRGACREYFRPNLWPNTPDILTEYLQFGGRPAFMARLVLAATLGASYGIYGPAFELMESAPREPGSEEYLDSEKYEIRRWDLDRPDSLKDFIARVNRVRRENAALQFDHSLRFHAVDNEALICYSKADLALSNIVLVVVNLDPHHVQSGWIELPPELAGKEGERPYQVHDLLSGARYLWQGRRNFVQIDPRAAPAHVFRVRWRVRTERDFDYFM